MAPGDLFDAYEEACGRRLSAAQRQKVLGRYGEQVDRLLHHPGFIVRAAALSVRGRSGAIDWTVWADEADAEALRRHEARSPLSRPHGPRPTDASDVPATDARSRRDISDDWRRRVDKWHQRPPPLKTVLSAIDAAGEQDDFELLLELTRVAARCTGAGGGDLLEVARRVVGLYLRHAESLDDLPRITRRAKTHASDLAHGAPPAYREINRIFDEITVLLPDTSVYGRTKLCSLLRKVDRPSLAVQAVEGFREDDARNVAAMTTHAAALADMRRLPQARGRGEAAWRLAPQPQSACVLARIARMDNNPTIALKWAKEAWSRGKSTVSAQMLLATAALVGDDPAMLEASRWLGKHRDEDEANSDYVAVRAGWVLFHEGDLDGAEQIATRVLSRVPGYVPAEKLVATIHERATAEKRPFDG